MKTKSCYKAIVLLVTALFTMAGAAQETLTKEVNESWSGITDINVEHRHGELEVIPHNSPEVRLEASLAVSAKDKSDAQTVMDHFEINRGATGGKLTLRTRLNTKNWVTTNGNTRMKFDDGSKADGIKDINITYRLFVPTLENLLLTNKYEDIIISGDLSGNLTVRQYDAEVRGSRVIGDLNLDIKYGSAEFTSCANSECTIYDSEMELGQTKQATINSKYSEYKIASADAVTIQSYDDNIEIGEVSGAIKIHDKYSEIQINHAGSLNLDIYDADFAVGICGDIALKSKYTEFTFGKIGSLDIEVSYDDKFEIEHARSLGVRESKYSDYTIETLDNSLDFKGYNDNINVRAVSRGFDSCNLALKYGDVRLSLDGISGYNLEANCQYGHLKYPKPVSTSKHIEKNSNIEIATRIGSASGTANVTIEAYDVDIVLD